MKTPAANRHPALSRNLPFAFAVALIGIFQHSPSAAPIPAPQNEGILMQPWGELGFPTGEFNNAETQQIITHWPVWVSERLLKEHREETQKALKLLQKQLEKVCEALPSNALNHLKTVPLWLSPTYEGRGPTAEYHPSRQWLEEHGRDPKLARCVEFTNVLIFEKEIQRMPVMVLHELAHAYHHQVLGFDHPLIRKAYEQAVKNGSYDAVLHNDGSTGRAYAMTDPKEYFAETTEAFFGINDIYPFNPAELKKHDPEMYDLLQNLWERPPL